MKPHDLINLALVAILSAGISWFVATRFAVAETQIVVIDVAAAVKGLDVADPAYKSKLSTVMDRSNETANQYAEAGYIVLDGRGVARVPKHLLINPMAEISDEETPQ